MKKLWSRLRSFFTWRGDDVAEQCQDDVCDTIVAFHERVRKESFGRAMPVYTIDRWWVRNVGDYFNLVGTCPEHRLFRNPSHRMGRPDFYSLEQTALPEDYDVVTSPIVRVDLAGMTCWTRNSVYKLGAPAKPDVCLPALRELASRLDKIDEQINERNAHGQDE